VHSLPLVARKVREPSSIVCSGSYANRCGIRVAFSGIASPIKNGRFRQRSDRLRFRLRIEEKTMTADEYEKLPAVDRGCFMECPQCGEILSLEELLLHLAYKDAGSERLE